MQRVCQNVAIVVIILFYDVMSLCSDFCCHPLPLVVLRVATREIKVFLEGCGECGSISHTCSSISTY